jgi:hypothetical protein
LANLRANIFILKLKKEWKNASNISQILNLWNRTFLVNKSYFISYEKLLNLFINLGLLDKKMKSGNMIWTEDEDFLFELENVLLQI